MWPPHQEPGSVTEPAAVIPAQIGKAPTGIGWTAALVLSLQHPPPKQITVEPGHRDGSRKVPCQKMAKPLMAPFALPTTPMIATGPQTSKSRIVDNSYCTICPTPRSVITATVSSNYSRCS